MPVAFATAVNRVAAVEAKHEAAATDWRDGAIGEVEGARLTKGLEMVIVLAVLAEPYRVRRLEEPRIHLQACTLCLKEKCAPRRRAAHTHFGGPVGRPQLQVPHVPAPPTVAVTTLQRWNEALAGVRGELEREQGAIHASVRRCQSLLFREWDDRWHRVPCAPAFVADPPVLRHQL